MENELHQKIANRFRASAIPLVVFMLCFVFLSGWVVFPLIKALVWSGLLSFITYPFHQFLAVRVFRNRYPNLVAGLNTFLILFVLVIPMIAIAVALFTEGVKLYSFMMDWFQAAGDGEAMDFIWDLPVGKKILFFFPSIRDFPLLTEYLKNGLRVLGSWLPLISKQALGSLAHVAFSLVVITISTFFMSRDGHVLLEFIRDILPVPERQKGALFLRSRRMIQAVLYGVIFTAGLQGFLGGLGWYYCGLSNPVFFGVLMFLFATVPFMGTPIIWGPGSFYLFINGQTQEALILLIWGLLVVSGIDNVIRPIFISEGSKAPILLVFIGIIGGMLAWGVLGLFIGPLILAICVDLLDSYRNLIRSKKMKGDI